MKSPLLVLASGFALGILVVQREHSPVFAGMGSIGLMVGLAALCMLVGLVLLRADWRRTALFLAVAGFVTAGASAARLFEVRFAPDHVSHLMALGIDPSEPIRLEAFLISEPLKSSSGTQFDVEVRRLEWGRQTHSLRGKVRLRIEPTPAPESAAAAGSLGLHQGESIRALVRLRKPRGYQNPGSFDFPRWLKTIEDVYWLGTVKSPLLVEKLPGRRPAGLSTFFTSIRLRLLQAIDRLYPPWSREWRDGAVLKAVLLGDRSSLDSDTIENFRKTGLYHLLVIAGLHVGLLAALAGFFLRLFRLRGNWNSALVLVFLAGYSLLVEQRAPTLRATLMISIYLLGRFFYRQQVLLNAIGGAALVLLLYRPPWLFEPGFDLSFFAALVIAGLAVPILGRTTEPYRAALRQLEEADRDTGFTPRQAQFRLDLRALLTRMKARWRILERRPAVARALVTWPARLAVWTASLLLFSAILQLSLLLPMALTFHRVSLSGIGLNALAIPMMVLFLGFAVPTVMLGATLPALAVWPAKMLDIILGGLFSLTDLPGMPHWLSYRVPEPPAWVAWGFVLSLLIAAWALGRRTRAFWAALGASGIFVLCIAIHPFAPRIPSGVLEVTALDCGAGEVLFLVLPDQTTLLVDGGGSRSRAPHAEAFQGRRWDPGEEIVSPYLWSRGVEKIDVVVESRDRGVNSGGSAAVLRNFHTGEFWHGVNPALPSTQTLLKDARQRGIRVREVAAGDHIFRGSTSIDMLWPPASSRGEAGPLFRAQGEWMIMRISTAEASVLVAGDVSGDAGRKLLLANLPLQSGLLEMAQRGSRTASGAEVFSRVSPQVAVMSGEDENAADRSSPETLDRLQAAGARVFRTALEGAVTVEMRGGSLAVQTYRRTLAGWGAEIFAAAPSDGTPSSVR